MPLETIIINDENLYDILIIGAGPAGLASAIYGAKSKFKTAFIEKSAPGGKVATIKEVHNYPGFDKIDGSVLAQGFYNEALEKGAKHIYGNVINIAQKLDYLVVYCENGEHYFTKSLIIATGTENTKLNITGEDKYLFSGVSYCVLCDGALAAKKNSVVVGNNPEALSSALKLSKISKKVYLLTNNQPLIESPITKKILLDNNIDILENEKIIEIKGNDFYVTSILVIDNNSNVKTIKTDFVFINLGYSPATNFLNNFDILSESKIIKTNNDKSTSINGIFAAGDVIKEDNKQIINAINEGIEATASAIKYIKEVFPNLKNGKSKN